MRPVLADKVAVPCFGGLKKSAKFCFSFKVIMKTTVGATSERIILPKPVEVRPLLARSLKIRVNITTNIMTNT